MLEDGNLAECLTGAVDEDIATAESETALLAYRRRASEPTRL
jgi:hypothetical protein